MCNKPQSNKFVMPIYKLYVDYNTYTMHILATYVPICQRELGPGTE